MAQQTINVGTTVNDGTGDTPRNGGIKINENFTELYAHASSTSNPHSVTKSQVGLSDVDNTSDVNKPVSTATQTALNRTSAVRVVKPTGLVTSYVPATDSDEDRGTALSSAVAALANGDTLILAPGLYDAQVTISANDVTVVGNGGTIKRMLVSGLRPVIREVNFGAASVNASSPNGGSAASLNNYLCWLQKPGRVESCNFFGSTTTGVVGLLIGDGENYPSTTTGDGSQRHVVNCNFYQLSAGLVLNARAEYYTISGIRAMYCGDGILVLSGNHVIDACQAMFCTFGIAFSYNRNSGNVREYTWSSPLSSPPTFLNAGAANAYHCRASNLMCNHNTRGVVAENSLNGADAFVYGIHIHSSEFHSNTSDTFNNQYENLNIYDSYLRSAARGDAGSTTMLHRCTANIYTANGAGAIINAFDPIASGALTLNELSGGKVNFRALRSSQTLTTAGTTGDVTIERPSGSARIAAGGTSVTVTNSLVTATSIIQAVCSTNDTTAYVKNVVASSGSFAITLGAAATAETEIRFVVINP
jgi:hypothetical protein